MIPTATPESDFKNVLLKDIEPDPNQPRKFYDETTMQELTDSIRTKGVLQPVLIRPKGKGYMLVCGERRYRASVSVCAAFKSPNAIPAVIRELSDEEALELQITENLQRQDVHPMEEAVAFRSLKENRTRPLTVEDIALKVGKTPQFVAQRLSLCNLIAPFQELFFGNALKIKDAVALSRLEETAQKAIYKEANVPKDWRKRKNYEVGGWLSNYVSQHQHELASAPFKTEDPNLYAEMGACGKCRFNSAANPVLFDDVRKKRICHNAVCFTIKCQRTYKQSLEKASENPEVVFISASNYPNAEEKHKIKAAEELGVSVLPEDVWEVFSKPTPVEPWEQWLKEHDHWSGSDDYNDEEKEEALQECKEEYNLELEEHTRALAAYTTAVERKQVKKAFVVVGNWKAKAGTFVDIVIAPKKGAKIVVQPNDSADTKRLALDTEIAAIEQREARNTELDREKVFKCLMDLFKNEGSAFRIDEKALSAAENVALLYALSELSYKVRDYLNQTFQLANDYRGFAIYNALIANSNAGIFHKAVRLFLYDKLLNANECDPGRYGKAAAMQQISTEYWPEQLAAFQHAQNEKAAKRRSNVGKRLESLSKQRSEATGEAVAEDAEPVKEAA